MEDYILDARYSRLAPLYWEWQKVYEEAFEEQGLHLGNDVDIFPNLNDRVAWEVAGFLIAVWLVLQDHVESINYSPSVTSSYHIRSENLEEIAKRFLEDENALLINRTPH